MRVLVAGPSGAIGRQLVLLLNETGHDVISLVHTTPAVGGKAETVIANALDRSALTSALRGSDPDVVVNMLTAIPKQLNPRKFARQMALTNQLRTEGTANLIAATRGARLISQGLAYAYSPADGSNADEDRALWKLGPKPFRPSVAALLQMERLTIENAGVILRFGHLFGPGTMFAEGGSVTEQVRAGKAPIVGDGSGRFSFTHTHDAATAIVACLDKPQVRGPLNIVGDDPSPVKRWLPQFAEAVGGPEPKRVPAWLARLAAGSWGVAYMNGLVGADNRRARQRLDWRPLYGTIQQGFQAEFGSQHVGPSPVSQ
jgi:nucleoside-diphosphate-sugar epimerase